MRMRDELHIIISSDIANFSPSIYFHFSCSLTVTEGGGRRNVPMPCLVCFIKKDELPEDARRAPLEKESKFRPINIEYNFCQPPSPILADPEPDLFF